MGGGGVVRIPKNISILHIHISIGLEKMFVTVGDRLMGHLFLILGQLIFLCEKRVQRGSKSSGAADKCTIWEYFRTTQKNVGKMLPHLEKIKIFTHSEKFEFRFLLFGKM